MRLKSFRILIWFLIILYLIWFFLSTGLAQIIVGLAILSFLLVNNFLEPIKNKQDKASHETFYDALKFIVFGIFSIIYPSLKNINFLVFIFGFVIVLHIINLVKIKSESKVSS